MDQPHHLQSHIGSNNTQSTITMTLPEMRLEFILPYRRCLLRPPYIGREIEKYVRHIMVGDGRLLADLACYTVSADATDGFIRLNRTGIAVAPIYDRVL